MAITPVQLNDWNDVKAFFENLRDANNSPFFTQVILNTTDNVLALYTADSVPRPFCYISTNSGSIVYCYNNSGTQQDSSNQAYGFESLVFPLKAYYTSYGAMLDIHNSTYGSYNTIAVCKSNSGRTVIATLYQYDVFTSNNILKPRLHCDDEKPLTGTSDVWGFNIESTSYTHLNQDFTALVPLPLNVKTGTDYTANFYLNLIYQTKGTYGSYSYQGHNYLTNGVFSILDT